jgi:hypothetical protein
MMLSLPVVAVMVATDGDTLFKFADGSTLHVHDHTLHTLQVYASEWAAFVEGTQNKGEWCRVK